MTVPIHQTCVIAARKTTHFAVPKASTQSRINFCLRLREQGFGKRLVAAGNFGGGCTTRKVALHSPDGVDAQLVDWLRESYRPAGRKRRAGLIRHLP